MNQGNLFGEPDTTKKVAALKARRNSTKGMVRKSDPASSFEAAGQFRESRGVETHESMILNALYRLGNATGHELVDEIAKIYPEKPLTHTQVMRRTGAMGSVAKGKVRMCVCGGRCQEMTPKEVN